MSSTVLSPSSPAYYSPSHRQSPGPRSPRSPPPHRLRTHLPPLAPPPSSSDAQPQQHPAKQALPPPPAPQQQQEYIQVVALSREEEDRRRALVRAYEGLSEMCSQFHRSEYNRLKWGSCGAPIYYVPLSVQLPEHVKQMMDNQTSFEASLLPISTSPDSSNSTSPVTTNSSDATRSASPKEPKDAADEQLEKHIALASSQPADGRRLAEEEGLQGVAVGQSDPTVASKKEVVVERSERREKSTEGGQGVEDRIREAIADPIVPVLDDKPSSAPSGEIFSSIEAGRLRVGAANGVQVVDTAQLMLPTGMKTSDTHPINISILIPPSSLFVLSPLLTLPISPSPKPLALPSLLSLPKISQSSPATDIYTPDGSQKQVGNFLMSSCPGKKVRLGGPVKGRGAICRDLESDLKRIQSLGVGAMICCLDDSELHYLGSPISLYQNLASSLGLTLIRIPMPEGLTPASLERFDSQIEHVVREFTLKGVSVLAHCRGGVGRAGLVACAWAIKMGLIPSSSSSSPPTTPSPTSPKTASESASPDSPTTEEQLERLSFGDDHGRYSVEDLQVARDVIGVVRRRRSVKAIETYEQVRWLVDYVRLLRERREAQ